jgi:molybdopterin-dependent oxidoreductase alpha subunit
MDTRTTARISAFVMPEEKEKPDISKPEKTAAGLDAVISTGVNVYGKMGVVRGTRGMLKINQAGGFDCPSCAWPDPETHRAAAEFCESGAKAMADEATKKRIGAEFFAQYSIDELNNQTDHWLNDQGRLTEPVILREGSKHYEPITWRDALETIAAKLNSLGSPDEAVFYTSGRTSNEAAFLYQLFVRQVGTNNLPDCSNMCHESTSVALAESIGLGKATVRLEDLENTDLIIIIGQNPGTCAPRMMTSLAAAKKNGAKMIAINPLAEAGLMNFKDPNPQHGNPLALFVGKAVKLADLHLPVRVGGDMAVLKGLMKTMLEREREKPGTVFDHDFIGAKTEGYDELIATLGVTSWDDILESSGLTREQISEAAEMIMASGKFVTCWAMGVTQHVDAVATIQDIVNLHLLRGAIGRPGAGLCPVRGHSNVQGDRTMGIWEQMNPAFRKNLEKEFNFKTPEKDGYNTVESIAAMRDGRLKVFFAMGGNFAAASPDTEAVKAAIENCDLTVQVLTKLNRTAVTPGKVSLILPCLGRSEIDRSLDKCVPAPGEQFVSTESTMLNVQSSRGIFEPASEHLRSEVWIVANLAKATLGERATVDWDAMAADYDNIRDAISRVVPGCADYNERIRRDGGFYMPNPPRTGVFKTPSGRALFKTASLEKITLKPGRLLMTTIRSHGQFNTTIYNFRDRYRGVDGSRRVIFMNVNDIAAFGLETGQPVDIISHFDDGEREVKNFAIVAYEIPETCCAAYFPEANPLIPLGSVARRSNTPTSKCTIVSVKPAGEDKSGPDVI